MTTRRASTYCARSRSQCPEFLFLKLISLNTGSDTDDGDDDGDDGDEPTTAVPHRHQQANTYRVKYPVQRISPHSDLKIVSLWPSSIEIHLKGNTDSSETLLARPYPGGSATVVLGGDNAEWTTNSQVHQ